MNAEQRYAPTIRWMLANKDLDQVMAIAKKAGSNWDEDDFYESCHNNDNVNLVIEDRGDIFGYAVYRQYKHKVEIIQIATCPVREGYGRDLIELIASRMTKDRRRIEVHVSEWNLDAQLFFKAMGFRAVRVYEDKHTCTHYVFVRKVEFTKE